MGKAKTSGPLHALRDRADDLIRQMDDLLAEYRSRGQGLLPADREEAGVYDDICNRLMDLVDRIADATGNVAPSRMDGRLGRVWEDMERLHLELGWAVSELDEARSGRY